MRKRLRLKEVVDKGGSKLKFEDADFALLQNLVAKTPWRMINREIVDFSDYIKDAKQSK